MVQYCRDQVARHRARLVLGWVIQYCRDVDILARVRVGQRATLYSDPTHDLRRKTKFQLPSVSKKTSVPIIYIPPLKNIGAGLFSSVQFIDSMPQLNDRMTEQICRQ